MISNNMGVRKKAKEMRTDKNKEKNRQGRKEVSKKRKN